MAAASSVTRAAWAAAAAVATATWVATSYQLSPQQLEQAQQLLSHQLPGQQLGLLQQLSLQQLEQPQRLLAQQLVRLHCGTNCKHRSLCSYSGCWLIKALAASHSQKCPDSWYHSGALLGAAVNRCWWHWAIHRHGCRPSGAVHHQAELCTMPETCADADLMCII